MTHVVIATPVDGDKITGQVSAGYAIPLAMMLSSSSSLSVIPAQITYSADVSRARNRLAAMVLRELPSASHVLWWDSDVCPHDFSIIARMLATGEPVIGAPYLRKRAEATWAHRGFIGREGYTAEDVARGWMDVWGLGFGFTLTSVEALRTVSSSAREYVDKRNDGTKVPTRGIFDLAYLTDQEGDEVQDSEDMSFCWRWRNLGGRCALYLGEGNLLSHVGHHAYRPGVKGEPVRVVT